MMTGGKLKWLRSLPLGWGVGLSGVQYSSSTTIDRYQVFFEGICGKVNLSL
jgi:hypothetical protein